MRETPIWRRYLRFLGSDPAADVEDELAFHLSMRVEDLMKRGMSEAEARRQAEREFGDVRQIRSEMNEIGRDRQRRQRRARWWDSLGQDVRYAVRAAVNAPLFSVLAIVTLALGIGANAAVFGVVKSVLLDSLPYADADRLMRAYGRYEGSQERGPLSPGTVSDLRERQRSFESLAAFSTGTSHVVLGTEEGPRLASLAWVEPGLFRTLGVSPVLGRGFHDEDAASDTARVVVLTHPAWQRLFGGDRGVVGREVRINGIPRTVIGVVPRGFVGPIGEADFYMAFDLEPYLHDPINVRRSQWLGLVGRLKPGVGLDAARRELAAIGAELVREYPDDNAGISVVAMPLRDALVGDTRTPLLVLMASAALVLLIACANLAGALLSRTLSRRREFAVRVALGAGRGRLVRQLLTESTLLAVAGGAAGLLLAASALALLRGLALPALPPHAELSLDAGAVVVTALLALATGLAFGLAPALSVGGTNVERTLREEARGASESRRSQRLRGTLVAGQIALSLSLLAGAGLLARSLWAMASSSIGLDPDGVLSVAVQLPARDYGSWQDRLRFHQQFEARLRGLPGVVAVANTNELPTDVSWRNTFTIAGAPPPPEHAQQWVLRTTVSDDYFRTLRIPLLQGRIFDARDHNDAPPTAVISESMARRYWPGGDALGARIRLGPDPDSPPIEVIGIVGDVRNDLARPDAEPIAYRSNRQDSWGSVTFLVRTTGDPLALVRSVERELAVLDPGIPVGRIVTLRGLIGEGLAGRRLPVVLMSAFGALALLLASVGIYAMFASMAAAREREFGVRMALGSRPRAIAALVLRQGGAWMLAGLAGGALGVVLVVRLLGDLLYGVAPFDPLALGLALGVLLACAAVALLAPVRRATRVDPAMALRAE